MLPVLVTPKEPIEELWQSWGQPDIGRLPHGHISLSLCLAGLPGLTGRVLRWPAPRLDMPALERIKLQLCSKRGHQRDSI